MPFIAKTIPPVAAALWLLTFVVLPQANAQDSSTTSPVDASTAALATIGGNAANAVALPASTPPPSNDPLAVEEDRVTRLHGLYDLATGLVGRQHVVVAPTVFGGRRCDTGSNVYQCAQPAASHGGLAGVVIVPLVGGGGGHGFFELWPRVQTDQVSDGFYQFDREFRRMREVLAQPLDLPDASQPSDDVLSKRFATLASAFDATLVRLTDTESHAAFHDDIDRLRACLATLTSAPVLPRGTSNTATLTDPATACGNGIKAAGITHGWTMAQKLRYLNGLWREYDLLVDTQPLSRHWLLVGPLAGLSITDKFGDVLYGGGLEAGWKAGFRFTMAAGWRSSMQGSRWYLGNMDTAGWWVGVGLSGQLADQLIDGVLGLDRVFASGTGSSNP